MRSGDDVERYAAKKREEVVKREKKSIKARQQVMKQIAVRRPQVSNL